MNYLFFIFICAFSAYSTFASELPADFARLPADIVDHDVLHLEKRQAATSPPKKDSENNNYTSVKTKHGCKLYAKEISFFKRTAKDQGYENVEVKFPGNKLSSASDGTCGNWSGTIQLDYVGPFSSTTGQGKLDKMSLTFNISFLRPFGWWEVTHIKVDTSGDLIDGGKFQQTFNGSILKSMAVGASKKFTYACGQPPIIYYSTDPTHKLVYGLKFKNLQIQPFEWQRSPGNFTDYVDDCVPFFSIGIWMFLVVASVLLLIIFFGIGMISSLKTMDRFDDPKGKPLVISAKE